MSLRDWLPAPRAFAAFVFALALVSSAALGGVFGPTAQQTAEDLDPTGEAEAIAPIIIGGAVVAGAAAGAAGAWLAKDGGGVPEEQVEETVALENKQQMLDLHAALVSDHETAETFRTSMSNFVVDSKAVASMKAKTRMVELINNGTTNATFIEQQMDAAIRDYYAVRERNLVARYNQQMAQVNYTLVTAHNDSNIADDDFLNATGGGWYLWNKQPFVADGSYQLLNGTNVSVGLLQYQQKTGGTYVDVKFSPFVSGSGVNDPPTHLRVAGVSDSSWSESKNVTPSVAVNFSAYSSLQTDLRNASSEMTTQYDQTFVNGVLSSYQAGEINTTDIITPEMLASEWATSYNDTQAATYKWASLAALGLDSPDLENTSHVTIDYRKPMQTRYVTFNTTGVATTSGPVEVHIDGSGVDATHTLANASSGDSFAPRVKVPKYATVTLTGASSNQSISISAGNTVTYGGVQISVEDPSKFLRVEESGMLFARDAPSTGFVVGETYDADNRSMYFVPAGQNTSTIRLGGDVTLVGAEDRQGNELNAVDVKSYNYQTASAENLTEQLTQLAELRKEIESREPIAVGGGGTGGGGGSPVMLAAILAVVLAAVVITQSGGNGGGRYRR